MTPKELYPACCPSYPVVLLSIFRMELREGGRSGDRRLFCSFDLGAEGEMRECTKKKNLQQDKEGRRETERGGQSTHTH